MRTFVTAIVLWTTAALPAQQQSRIQPYPIDLPEGFVQAMEAGTRTATGKPGAAHWTNYARYRIEAELDPKSAMITGRAEMTYVNRSPDDLDRLPIHLRQNLHRAGAMRTRNVEVTDGVEITELLVNGQRQRRRPRVRDTRLTVRLGEDLSTNEEVTITIGYRYKVPTAGRAPRNGHEGEDVFYLAYWYPQFAVYDDVEGWVADQYRGNGEFYMGYADYDIHFTAPVGYLVRSTGVLQNPEQVLTEKARKALAEAETSDEVIKVIDQEDLDAGNITADSESGKLTWHYLAENVRDVAVSVARTYLWDATHAVVKDKHGPGKDGKAMIHAVYEPRSGQWPRAAEHSRHTVEFMSEMVYPYPWPHMTACEGVIGGGMEFPMMTIVGRSGNPGTIAHEIIHMWFPMIVGSNEKRYAWQDEGITSFWTSICRDDATNRTSGAQRDIVGYVARVRSGGDAVCFKHGDSYVTQSFGFASYSKTAAILHQLRGLLGDEAFFEAFRRYTEDWAYKHPYPYDMFRSFANSTGQDLEPYFRTWFFEDWKLDHAIAEVDQANGKTTVRLADLGRAVLPTVIEATFADGSTMRREVPAQHWQGSRQAAVEFDGDAVSIALDPDYVTLDIDRKNNDWKKEGGE